MILFPNAKINLGLRIVGKRADGYHDLESIFYPVNLKDVLEVIESDTFSFSISGLPVPGDPAHNLAVQAYELVREQYPKVPPASVYLLKNIPAGAGLGGGSSDAAYMLKLLNSRFQLGMKTGELCTLATKLGSDCPFFILNEPALAQQRGEQMEAIRLNLSAYVLVLIHPGIHIDTAWAFSQVQPSLPDQSLKIIIDQPITTWKDELINDFERAIFARYPVLQHIKNMLYQAGAIYSSMTGSGSSIYGIFDKRTPLRFSFEPQIRVDILN